MKKRTFKLTGKKTNSTVNTVLREEKAYLQYCLRHPIKVVVPGAIARETTRLAMTAIIGRATLPVLLVSSTVGGVVTSELYFKNHGRQRLQRA